MGVVAVKIQATVASEAVVRRTFLLRRPDWFLALMLLVVAVPNDAWEWFSVPRWPNAWEWGLLAFMMLLCTTNPWSLWKRAPVMMLQPHGF